MSSSPAPAERRSTVEIRQRLVNATRSLLMSEPPNTITVRAIGAEAGLPFGHVRRHFGNRDSLIVTAAGEILSDWAAAIEKVDPEDAAHAALDFLMDNGYDLSGRNAAFTSPDTRPSNLTHPAAEAIERQLERTDHPATRPCPHVGLGRHRGALVAFADTNRDQAHRHVHHLLDLILDPTAVADG
jgi:AcrR family transcriptional regulator